MESSQEEEYVNTNSKLGKLIVKVNNIEKKPCLDNSLSEVLDMFLEKLKQSEDFLSNGIFQINFAEAALLLQSSAFVYSKKVDLLWDAINQCQKRMVSFKTQENEVELKRLEEREQKYKRRRKVVEPIHQEKEKEETLDNFHVDWQDVHEFQNLPFEKDTALTTDWCERLIIHENVQPLLYRGGNMILAEKSCHFRSSNNTMFDKDQDDEFVAHTNKMESVMSLDNLISQYNPKLQDFSFEMYKELYIVPKFLIQRDLLHEDLDKHSEEIEEIIAKYKGALCSNDESEREIIRSEQNNKQQQQQIARRISIASTVMSTDIERTMNEKKCRVNVTRLSIGELSRLSRLSIDEMRKLCESFNEDDSGVHSEEDLGERGDGDEEDVEEEEVVVEKEVSVENSASCDPVENVDENNGKKMDKKSSSDTDKIVEENSFDFNGNILIRVDYNKNVEDSENVDMLKRSLKRAMLMEAEDHAEVPMKKRKLSKAEMKKLAKSITVVTVDWKEFNTFFSMHYQPDEGEGSPDMHEFDPVDSSSLIDPREAPLTQMSESIVCTQDSGYESRIMDDNFDARSPLSLPGPSLSTTPLIHEENILIHQEETENSRLLPAIEEEDEQRQEIEREETRNENHPEDEKPLHQKVYEWKQFMVEKLKKTKSTDFDIHEYGSRIMENLDAENPKKFGDIVMGKSSAEVTRFFISSLQLANTYNVEIRGAQSGKLSNDTFSLKLLTKERCYDKLKDYMAPSEENFENRLKSVRNTMKKRVFYKTVDGGECSKRTKYDSV